MAKGAKQGVELLRKAAIATIVDLRQTVGRSHKPLDIPLKTCVSAVANDDVEELPPRAAKLQRRYPCPLEQYRSGSEPHAIREVPAKIQSRLVSQQVHAASRFSAGENRPKMSVIITVSGHRLSTPERGISTNTRDTFAGRRLTVG